MVYGQLKFGAKSKNIVAMVTGGKLCLVMPKQPQKNFEKSSFFYSQCFHNQFLWLGIEC